MRRPWSVPGGARLRADPGNPAWIGLAAGQQITQVLREPGETAGLYCPDPCRGCPYETRFSPGTPDVVITVVIEAALAPGRPGPDQAGRAGGGEPAKEVVTRDDDR